MEVDQPGKDQSEGIAVSPGIRLDRQNDRNGESLDPFDGFFQNNKESPTPGSVVDIPLARQWFERIREGIELDLYTFQQDLEGRTGPRVMVRGQELLMLSSYDYLGLIGHPEIENAAKQAIDRFGTSSGGVRLLTGTMLLHRDLERSIAHFLNTEAALCLSSGYAANLSAITALFGPRDEIYVDSLAHRSIMDACTLSGSRVFRFRHNDMKDLMSRIDKSGSHRRKLIIVEGAYSMDGDLCPLPEIIDIKEHFGAWLMVDEAHSIGMVGDRGRGITEAFGIDSNRVDVITGSLSKAIPSNGGFIAGSAEMIIYLQHAGAPFMFSAALSPPSTAAAMKALEIIETETELLVRMRSNAEKLRSSLNALGYDTGQSESSIIPVITGDEYSAITMGRELINLGVFTTPVIYPSVAIGKERLRLCATAALSEDDLEKAGEAFSIYRRQYQKK